MCFLRHTNIRGALHYYHATEQEVSLKLRMLCRSKVDNKGLIRHQFSREKEKTKTSLIFLIFYLCAIDNYILNEFLIWDQCHDWNLLLVCFLLFTTSTEGHVIVQIFMQFFKQGNRKTDMSRYILFVVTFCFSQKKQ